MNSPIRLAMRVEGTWWVAYLAHSDTMEGASEVGRIRLSIVKDQDRRTAFIEIMTKFMSEVIKDRFGVVPDWKTEPAPESERSGSA